MANKRNTKMVLASLLATSAIVPAISASAEVGGDITRSGDAVTTSVEATPINAEEVVVKLSYSNPMAANFLPSTGTFLDDDGASFIVVELSETTASALTSVKVDGQEVLIKSEEGNIVLLPLVGPSETITVSVESSFGPMELVVTPEFPTEEGTEETDTDEGEEVTDEEPTSNVEQTIAIDIEDASGMLSRFINPTATLMSYNGQTFMAVEVLESARSMVNDAKIGENSVLRPNDDTKTLYIPVNESFDAVEVVVTVTAPFGPTAGQAVDYTVTVKGDPDTITEATEEPTVPAEPEENEAPAQLKYLAYNDVPDGVYDVSFDAYDSETGEGNYGPITRQLDAAATLVVENGEYFLEINEIERPNKEGVIESWITEYQVEIDGEYVTAETVAGELGEYPHVVRLPLASLNDLTTAKLHVVAPEYGMDKWYDFQIAIVQGQALPQVVPTYVYKDGTNELSIMQETYLSATSVTALTEDGTYLVDLEFPKGQFLVGDLVFNGETYAVTESYEDGDDTVKIYTVEVDDLSKIYNATFDLDVQGFYKTQHTAQIQFGGEKNPFGDITKSYDWAYSQIVSLYNKDIFKAADTFNPANNLQRGHFALMLARAFELEVPATTPFTDLRSDVEEQNAIKALNAYGIINGKSTNTFAPADSILRYEAALMIDRLLNKYGVEADATNTVTFTDVKDAKSKEAVEKLASLQIINGKGDGKFDPNGTLTRAEMAKILDNALKIIEKQ